MKIKYFIQRIESLYNKGVQSDDSRLRPRHIFNKLLTVRNLLISQKANKRQNLGSELYQTLDCIEMLIAPIHDCPCAPPSGCVILKSKYKIPELISDSNRALINYISSIDGNINFSETTWRSKKYKTGNRFSKIKPDYFFKNGYLYITTLTTTSLIVVLEGVFKDPLAVKNFKSLCDDCIDCKSCDSILEMELPLDSSLEEPLIALTIEELVGNFNNQKVDSVNNGQEE